MIRQYKLSLSEGQKRSMERNLYPMSGLMRRSGEGGWERTRVLFLAFFAFAAHPLNNPPPPNPSPLRRGSEMVDQGNGTFAAVAAKSGGGK